MTETARPPVSPNDADSDLTEMFLTNVGWQPAFLVGIASGLAWRAGYHLDRRLLYNASIASGPLGVEQIVDAWLREKSYQSIGLRDGRLVDPA